MCSLKLYLKLPIFVARQLVRHRTASLSEYSARYSVLKDEFHIPDLDQLVPQSKDNRQGRAEVSIENLGLQEHIQEEMKIRAESEFSFYNWLIGQTCQMTDDIIVLEYDRKLEEHETVSRELARINLPLSTYTEWYWKIDLHNLMHFLQLRCDSHAQYEIRVYADVINQILKDWLPLTYNAFEEHRLKAQSISATGGKFIAELVNVISQGDSKNMRYTAEGLADRMEINNRERDQLFKLLKID